MLPSERETPAIADDVTPATAEVAAAAVEAKPEAPKVDVTDDPQTWPEPAQRAHEAVTAKVAGYEAELGKWREAGPRAVQQNQRLAEENKLLRSVVQQAGAQIDPRDLDLIGYRVAESAQKQKAEWDAKRAEHEKTQGVEAQRAEGRREAVRLVNEITTAAKGAGLDMREVGLIVHSQIALNGKPDIGAAVQLVKDRALLAHRQAAANTPAPVRSTLPSSNLQPHDRSRLGKEARLKQWGAS